MIEDMFSTKGKAQQRKLFIIVVSTIFLLWAGVGIPYPIWKAKEEFEKFNNASVYGRITMLQPTKIGVRLKVNRQEFTFYPIADEKSNNYQSFSAIATIGDSVSKAVKADTLVLFAKSKVYKYPFKKH